MPIRVEIGNIERDGHWLIHGAVIMPDHIHLLFTLSDHLPLARVIARLKAKTKAALEAARLGWQGNYYEHRLRPDETIETVIRYIYLNPYRAGLVAKQASYSGFWLGEQEKTWFMPTLDDGRPFPEWLC